MIPGMYAGLCLRLRTDCLLQVTQKYGLGGLCKESVTNRRQTTINKESFRVVTTRNSTVRAEPLSLLRNSSTSQTTPAYNIECKADRNIPIQNHWGGLAHKQNVFRKGVAKRKKQPWFLWIFYMAICTRGVTRGLGQGGIAQLKQAH